MHLRPRGFTLIELLVVIAIIGILAGIVLASLGTVRNKGGDAGVSGNLTGMRTKAELFAQSNGSSYDGFCVSVAVNGGKTSIDAAKSAAGVTSATGVDAAGAANTATCNDSTNAWGAQVPLKSVTSQFWCVDSLGYSGTTTSSVLTSATDYACN